MLWFRASSHDIMMPTLSLRLKRSSGPVEQMFPIWNMARRQRVKRYQCLSSGGGGGSEIKAVRESDDKQKFKGKVPQGSWDLEWCVKAPFGVQRLRAVFTVGGTVCQIMTQQVELGGEVLHSASPQPPLFLWMCCSAVSLFSSPGLYAPINPFITLSSYRSS